MSKYVSGFCITKHHDNCHKSLTYYDKTWVCECECHASDTESDTPAQASQKVSDETLNKKLDKQPNRNKNNNPSTLKGSDK